MLHYILKPKTVYLTRSFYFDWTVVQFLLGLNRSRFLQLQNVEKLPRRAQSTGLSWFAN